ncbi:MAG: hypothetical protein BWX90_00829 [bacterium ADurb.Bin132]|nr:MAG: hypothetical protein BWX90_00829 [bacterium ADurb.Bin132]
MAFPKAMKSSLESSFIETTTSACSSSCFGFTSKPRLAKHLAHKSDPLSAEDESEGAAKSPLKASSMKPHVAPTSAPMPGAVTLVAILETRLLFPTIYPPVKANPPPGFFISEPTERSAPAWHGSFSEQNSQ